MFDIINIDKQKNDMKKTIAIVLMAIATSVFGSQQTQAAEAEARARHIAEVQRAIAERNFRIINSRIIVEENKKSCPAVIMPNGIICRTIHPSQYGFGIGEIPSDTENKTSKIKQNSRLISNDPRWGNRNLNQRKFKSSGPARRRK